MWEGAEATSGLAPERIHIDGEYPQNDADVVTTGGSGFGIAGLIVGMERGFIPREEGVTRLHQIADYLAAADRFHGVWPHWIHGPTGKVKPFGKKDNGGDLVESAFLMQGLLIVREYFKNGSEREQELAQKIDTRLERDGMGLVSERTGCALLALESRLWMGDELRPGGLQRMSDHLYTGSLLAHPSCSRISLP